MISVKRAKQLEDAFLGGITEAQDAYEEIVATQAWTLLGYDTFAEWWTDRVTPIMRSLSMRPTRQIAAKVVQQIQQEEAALPPVQRRTQREMAELIGVSGTTVGRKGFGYERTDRIPGDGTLGTVSPRSRVIPTAHHVGTTVDRDQFRRIDDARRRLSGSWSMADFVRKAVFEFVRAIEDGQADHPDEVLS